MLVSDGKEAVIEITCVCHLPVLHSEALKIGCGHGAVCILRTAQELGVGLAVFHRQLLIRERMRIFQAHQFYGAILPSLRLLPERKKRFRGFKIVRRIRLIAVQNCAPCLVKRCFRIRTSKGKRAQREHPFCGGLFKGVLGNGRFLCIFKDRFSPATGEKQSENRRAEKK